MTSSTKLKGSKKFGANLSLFYFLIFEFYMQKILNLQKSSAPYFFY